MPQQIIGGQTYEQYTPAWYAAMDAQKVHDAGVSGTAAGTAVKNAGTAVGLPPLTSGSTSLPTGTVPAFTPATVPPSIAGLSAAAGVSPPSGGGGGSAGASAAPHLAPVDTSAAEAATFDRAKDQVGQTASGALMGLRSALGGRGMLGGGVEGRATAGVVNAGQQQLGDVSREAAVTHADLAQKNAEANFTGGITERGQDLQKEEAGNSLAADLAKTSYSGAITQRGQDIQNANAQASLQVEMAQLAAQQRATALSGLESALRVTSPGGLSY